MKKSMIIIISFVIFCIVASPSSKAVNLLEEQASALNTDELEDAVPESAEDAVEGIDITDTANIDGIIERFREFVKEKASYAFKDTLKSSSSVIAAAVFCSLISSLYPKGGGFASLVCILAISAVMVTHSTSLVREGEEMLEELDAFSKVLLPTLSTAAAASGSVTASAAKYAAAALFLDISISASNKLVIPLIYAYTASSIASAAFGGNGLRSACELIKWAAVTSMTLIVLTFTVYLSLSGIIAGTVDASAVKAARVTISTVLPVVGGMISDAAAAVLAGASILKGAIGVFGLIVVLAIITVPFIKLGLGLLVYKLAAAIAGVASENNVGQLILSLSVSFGLLLGMVGSVGIMLFISIVSVIRTVT